MQTALQYDGFVPLCNNKITKKTVLTWLSWNFSQVWSQRMKYLADSGLLKGISHQQAISSLSFKGCSPVSTGILSQKLQDVSFFHGSLLGEIAFSFCCGCHFTLQPHLVEVLSHKWNFRWGFSESPHALLACLQWDQHHVAIRDKQTPSPPQGLQGVGLDAC